MPYLIPSAEWLLRVVIDFAAAWVGVVQLRAAAILYRDNDRRGGREKTLSAAGFGMILLGSLASATWLYGPNASTASILMLLPYSALWSVALIALGFVLIAVAATSSHRGSPSVLTTKQPTDIENTVWPPPPGSASQSVEVHPK
jgi:uncharacterized membrane protein